MSKSAKTWRIERTRKTKKGQVRVLRTGRGSTRQSLSLGVVTQTEAERAKERMNLEEAQGTAQRVVALREENPEACIAYLLGDPAVDLLRIPPAYKTWSLRRYYTEIFEPVRSVEVRGWPQERNRWNQILAGIGDVRLRDIDKWVVADWLDGLMTTRGPREGMPLSGNAKRNLRNVLRAALMYALRKKHITEMPDLTTFRIKGSTRRVTKDEEPLNLDELIRLMKAGPTPKHRAMWAVLGGNGLRPSELQRLRWELVDLEQGMLTIPGHSEGPGAGEGKTGQSATTIPLTPLALGELRSWWERCKEPVEGVMFWGARRGEAYQSTSGFKKALKTAAEAAGIERAVTPYLLRDSFATIAWSLNIERDVTRRILRHINEKMLNDVYCRPRPEELAERVKRFTAEQTQKTGSE